MKAIENNGAQNWSLFKLSSIRIAFHLSLFKSSLTMNEVSLGTKVGQQGSKNIHKDDDDNHQKLFFLLFQKRGHRFFPGFCSSI